MNDEYQVWLLLVLLAVAGAVLWQLYGHLRRDEEDVVADERALEADWIAGTLAARGQRVPPETVEAVLELHRRYLAGPGFDAGPLDERSAALEQAASARDDTAMERHDTRRQAPEADAGQAG
ncbi:MAG TPA: hypothetical protein VFK38_01095 [Candidatus Limnocylindrales bacterium]|nr:hypothetical protein [Candidatus Limnocylindrales bacterium]